MVLSYHWIVISPVDCAINSLDNWGLESNTLGNMTPGGGVKPYMGHIGMCRCEGYGFQAVYSSIGYINQSVWGYNRLSFLTKLTSWLKILSRLRKPGIYSSIG